MSILREFGFLIPVVADGLTETQKKAYVIADNQLALNAGWDLDILHVELEALAEMNFDTHLLGFDDDFLRKLLIEENGGLTDPDDAPDLDESRVFLRDAYIAADARMKRVTASK